MHICIEYPMMINLKKFLKTLFEKYKRIVLVNRTRTLEGQSCLQRIKSFSQDRNHFSSNLITFHKILVAKVGEV
jgi:hypothetical protein